MAMKQLISPGVYIYPSTPEGLAEAKQDADNAASRYTMYVVQDRQGNYYGPVNEANRQQNYRTCSIVYTTELKIGDVCKVIKGVYEGAMVKIIALPDERDTRYGVERGGFAGPRLYRNQMDLVGESNEN